MQILQIENNTLSTFALAYIIWSNFFFIHFLNFYHLLLTVLMKEPSIYHHPRHVSNNVYISPVFYNLQIIFFYIIIVEKGRKCFEFYFGACFLEGERKRNCPAKQANLQSKQVVIKRANYYYLACAGWQKSFSIFNTSIIIITNFYIILDLNVKFN